MDESNKQFLLASRSIPRLQTAISYFVLFLKLDSKLGCCRQDRKGRGSIRLSASSVYTFTELFFEKLFHRSLLVITYI